MLANQQRVFQLPLQGVEQLQIRAQAETRLAVVGEHHPHHAAVRRANRRHDQIAHAGRGGDLTTSLQSRFAQAITDHQRFATMQHELEDGVRQGPFATREIARLTHQIIVLVANHHATAGGVHLRLQQLHYTRKGQILHRTHQAQAPHAGGTLFCALKRWAGVEIRLVCAHGDAALMLA